MEYAKRLVLWLCLAVGVSVASLVWRPIAGDGDWFEQIRNGELVLVSISITGSAVGYAAMAPVSGIPELIKSVIVGLGIVVLVVAIGIYTYLSETSSSVNQNEPSPGTIRFVSYVVFGASLLFGVTSTYLTHIAERRAEG